VLRYFSIDELETQENT